MGKHHEALFTLRYKILNCMGPRKKGMPRAGIYLAF